MYLNERELLSKLPHTGYQFFDMSNKQIKELLASEKPLKKSKIVFDKVEERTTAFDVLPKTTTRLLVFDETEMKEILFKKMMDFVGQLIDGFKFDSFSVGMKVDFNGEYSKLIFYCDDGTHDFDFAKINIDKASSKVTNCGYEYRFMDVDSDELMQFTKKE